MAKRAGSTYVSRRSPDWLKFKCSLGQEFVIGGYTEPAGSRIGLGALLVGYYEGGDLVYAGKVGTGFSTATLLALRRQLDALGTAQQTFTRGRITERGVHWVRPELVAEVVFSEWTTDGKLRHPRFEGLRTDKAAGEVQRERPVGQGGLARAKRVGAQLAGLDRRGPPAWPERRNSGYAVRCLTPRNEVVAVRSGLFAVQELW